MSSLDLDQVLYARAGWRKAILVPLWTFQVAVLLCLMGVFAYRLAETFDHYEEHDKMGEMPIVEVVWEATNVGFNLVALILNILEIARKATERLTPFMMVGTNVVKLTLAFAVLALDIVAYLKRMDGHYSTIGLSLDCGLLAANIASFTYALITYRRLLKYEDYDLTANAKVNHGYVPRGEYVELGFHKPSHGQTSGVITTRTTELRYSDAYSYSDGYPSQTNPPQSQSQSQPQSYVRPYPGPSQATSHPDPQHQPTPRGAEGQDTQPAAAAANLKKEVDRAIGAEFGWASPTADNSPHTNNGNGSESGNRGAEADVTRSGSVVVASGRVAVHHGPAALVVPGVQRQVSWATERGVITEEGEEEEDDDGRGGAAGVMGRADVGVDGRERGQRQGSGREEDMEALLPGR